MPILQDKKILLTGLLSNRSIAYGIGKALKREGATIAFTYAGEAMKAWVKVMPASRDLKGKARSALRGALQIAVNRGLLGSNPAAGISLP